MTNRRALLHQAALQSCRQLLLELRVILFNDQDCCVVTVAHARPGTAKGAVPRGCSRLRVIHRVAAMMSVIRLPSQRCHIARGQCNARCPCPYPCRLFTATAAAG
jgi:hypothetical protein